MLEAEKLLCIKWQIAGVVVWLLSSRQALTQLLDGKANSPEMECKVLFTSGTLLAAG